MRTGTRFLIWVLATAFTTAAAYVAVNAAGSQVTDQPVAVLASAPSTSLTMTTAPTASGTSITTAITTSTTTPVAATSSSTSAAATTPTSATTAPTSTTAPWQTTTVNSPGGLMIVSYRPGEVRLESVVPAPGFAYEINDDGPDRVEVEFELDDAGYRLRAEWTSDGFITEVDET